MRYEGYSYTDQMVSELSAIGSPVRGFAVTFFSIHSVLQLAFGVGAWRSAQSRRPLQISAASLIGIGLLALVAPFFPMNMRGILQTAENTALTDVMHILLTGLTVLLILLAIWFGSSANGKWFRIYSIGTLLLVIVFGALAGSQGPQVAADLPTPWFGIMERVSIYGYMLWMAVTAIVILREGQKVTRL